MTIKNRASVFLLIVFFVNSFLARSGANFIKFGNMHIDILELSVFSILLLLLLTMIIEAIRKKETKFEKATKIFMKNLYIFLPITVFTLGTIVSAAIGFLMRNNELLINVRGFLFLFACTLAFCLLIDNSNETLVFSKANAISFVLVALVLISFLSKSYTSFLKNLLNINEVVNRFDVSVSGSYGNYYLGISAALLFSFTYSATQSMLYPHKPLVLIISFLSFLSMLVFFHKPIVVLAVFTSALLFVLGVKIFGTKRGLQAFVVLVFVIIIAFLTIPDAAKQSLITSFKYKWLNIGRSGVEDDLSTGRFELWRDYFQASLRGYGFAPWGMGKALDGVINRNPHNHFVFLSFNTGIANALIFYVHISVIAVIGWIKGFKKNSYVVLSASTFVFGVLFLSLYSGILNATREFIFLFSMCYSVLLKTAINYTEGYDRETST